MLLISALKKLFTLYSIRKNPRKWALSIGVKIGENCSLPISPETFGSEPYLVKLGNNVHLAPYVNFITHDGGARVFRDEYPNIECFGSIEIGNNVMIGMHSIILPKTKIGDNTLVAAGSVVMGNIPPNSFIMGNPARLVKTFDQYKDLLLLKATFIRNLPPAEKRKKLEEMFFGGKD